MPTLPHTHSPQPFTFQQTLDVYDFCTDRLQERLKANRQANDLKNNPLKPSSATEYSGSAAADDSATTDFAQPMEVEETAIISGSGPVDTGIDSETMDAMLADVEDEEEREALRAALLMSVNDPPPTTTTTTSTTTTGTTRAPPTGTASTGAAGTSGAPVGGGGGLPDDFLGLYELHSMVTHKGRSADSGHYIGWVSEL